MANHKVNEDDRKLSISFSIKRKLNNKLIEIATLKKVKVSNIAEKFLEAGARRYTVGGDNETLQ